MAAYVPLLESAARTADVTSRQVSVYEKYEAAHIVIDVTAGSGFNLLFSVNGHDSASGKDYTILTSSDITGTGTTVLRVGPQYTAGANVAKDYLPALWSVAVTQSGGASATYSVGASLI